MNFRRLVQTSGSNRQIAPRKRKLSSSSGKNTKINMKYAKQSGVAQETVFQKIFDMLCLEIEVFMNVSLILTLIAYLVVFVTIGVAVQHVLKNFSSLGVAPRVRRS
jgi:hypothetical protein